MALLQVLFCYYRNIKWTLSYSVASLFFFWLLRLGVRRHQKCPDLVWELRLIWGEIFCPFPVTSWRFSQSSIVGSPVCLLSFAYLFSQNFGYLRACSVALCQVCSDCPRQAKDGLLQGSKGVITEKKNKLHEDFPQRREQTCLKLDVWLLAGEKAGLTESWGNVIHVSERVFLSKNSHQ